MVPRRRVLGIMLMSLSAMQLELALVRAVRVQELQSQSTRKKTSSKGKGPPARAPPSLSTSPVAVGKGILALLQSLWNLSGPIARYLRDKITSMASTPSKTSSKKGAKSHTHDSQEGAEGGSLHGAPLLKKSSSLDALAKVVQDVGSMLHDAASQTLQTRNWIGGPQNEAKGDEDMLGTEFIEYRRDPDQWKLEKDYATTSAPSNHGTKGDGDVSAGATTTSNRLRPFPLVIDAKSHPITEHGIKRLKEIIDTRRAGGSVVVGATLDFRESPGKGQNLAHELVMLQEDEGKRIQAAKEIAIVVAGNSGLPGGATSSMNSDSFLVNIDQIHNGHTTQEESVVANFYAHTSAKHARGQFPSFVENDGAKLSRNHAAELVVNLYRKTLQKKWGLKSCCTADDYSTYQGVESYVHTKNPIDYADAWVVRKPRIGPESRVPDLSRQVGAKKHNRGQDRPKIREHATEAYPWLERGGHQLGAHRGWKQLQLSP